MPVFSSRQGRLSGCIIRGALHKLNGAHHRREAALGSFPMNELGEALRIGSNLFSERPDAVPPSPNGSTHWPGFKVFALCAGYAHILARLRSPLQGFCLPKEGGFSSLSYSSARDGNGGGLLFISSNGIE